MPDPKSLPRNLRDEIEATQAPGRKGAEGEAERRGVGLSVTYAAPQCREKCRGVDANGMSTREAFDSPAKFGRERGTGRKVVWCPCCNTELIREDLLSAERAAFVVTNIRPANLSPEVTADHRRYFDIPCMYDVVVLKNLMPV